MSGNIKIKIRKGLSHDPRYKYYPEWYMEVTGENGQVVTLSPKYSELESMIGQILTHEKLVDDTRHRKIEFNKKLEIFSIENMTRIVKEIINNMTEIPKIYNYEIQDVNIEYIKSKFLKIEKQNKQLNFLKIGK
jgi:nitrate reductase alpha subunit